MPRSVKRKGHVYTRPRSSKTKRQEYMKRKAINLESEMSQEASKKMATKPIKTYKRKLEPLPSGLTEKERISFRRKAVLSKKDPEEISYVRKMRAISDRMRLDNESTEQREIRLAIARDYREAKRTPNELAARLAEEFVIFHQQGLLLRHSPLRPNTCGQDQEHAKNEEPARDNEDEWTLADRNKDFEDDYYEKHLKMMENETPEEWARRLAAICEEDTKDAPAQGGSAATPKKAYCRAHQLRLQRETPEQREKRLKYSRERNRYIRANLETPEQEAKRLAKMRERCRLRNAKETPEQRAKRLDKMNLREKRRRMEARSSDSGTVTVSTDDYSRAHQVRLERGSETPELYALRLAREKEQARLRRANETPEQRAKRLEKMNTQGKQRRIQAMEKMTEEEREAARLRHNAMRVESDKRVKARLTREEKDARNAKARERRKNWQKRFPPEVVTAKAAESHEKFRIKKLELQKKMTPEELLAKRVATREKMRKKREMETEELRLAEALQSAEDPDQILKDENAQKVIEWWYNFNNRYAPKEVKDWRKNAYKMMKDKPSQDETLEERKARLAKNCEVMKQFYAAKAEQTKNNYLKNKAELNAYSRLYWKQKIDKMSPEEVAEHKEQTKQRHAVWQAEKKAGIERKRKRGRQEVPSDSWGYTYKRRKDPEVRYVDIAPVPTRIRGPSKKLKSAQTTKTRTKTSRPRKNMQKKPLVPSLTILRAKTASTTGGEIKAFISEVGPSAEGFNEMEFDGSSSFPQDCHENREMGNEGYDDNKDVLDDDGHDDGQSSQWTHLGPTFQSLISNDLINLHQSSQFDIVHNLNNNVGTSEMNQGFGFPHNNNNTNDIRRNVHSQVITPPATTINTNHNSDHQNTEAYYPAGHFQSSGVSGGAVHSLDLNALITYQQQQQQLQPQKSWNSNMMDVELPLNYSLHFLPNAQVSLIPQQSDISNPLQQQPPPVLGHLAQPSWNMNNGGCGSSVSDQFRPHPLITQPDALNSNNLLQQNTSRIQLLSSTNKRKRNSQPQKRSSPQNNVDLVAFQGCSSSAFSNGINNNINTNTTRLNKCNDVENNVNIVVKKKRIRPSPNPRPIRPLNPLLVEIGQTKERLRPKCPHCTMVLSSQRAYEKHLKRHEAQKYTCKACNAGFKGLSGLSNHIWFGHYDNEKTYECPLCPSKFAWKHLLQGHLSRTHVGHAKNLFVHGVTSSRKDVNEAGEFRCSLCPAVFTGFLQLNSHFNSSHQNKLRHSCKHCGIILRIQTHLHEHILRFHSNEEKSGSRGNGSVSTSKEVVSKEIKDFEEALCSVCDSRFVNEEFLMKHRLATGHLLKTTAKLETIMERSSLDFNYCPACHQGFYKKESRDKHFRRKCIKSLSCISCNESFATEHDLQAHFDQKHKDEKSTPSRLDSPFLYKCERCPRSFNTIITLRSHFNIEHETNGTSTLNNYTEGEAQEKAKNEESCAGVEIEKVSKCLKENDRFTERIEPQPVGITQAPVATNNETMACLGDVDLPSPTIVANENGSADDETKRLDVDIDVAPTITVFQCKVCLTNFSAEEFLEIHMEAEHPDPRTHRPRFCEHCNKPFTTRAALVRHMKQFHNPNRVMHKCPYCPIELSRAEHVKGHVKRVHENPNYKPSSKESVNEADKKHRCEICKKGFVIKKNLTLHMTNVHFRHNFSTFCDFCGKQIRPEYLLGHLRKVHPEQAPDKVRSGGTLRKLPLEEVLSLLSEIQDLEALENIGKRNQKISAKSKAKREVDKDQKKRMISRSRKANISKKESSSEDESSHTPLEEDNEFNENEDTYLDDEESDSNFAIHPTNSSKSPNISKSPNMSKKRTCRSTKAPKPESSNDEIDLDDQSDLSFTIPLPKVPNIPKTRSSRPARTKSKPTSYRDEDMNLTDEEFDSYFSIYPSRSSRASRGPTPKPQPKSQSRQSLNISSAADRKLKSVPVVMVERCDDLSEVPTLLKVVSVKHKGTVGHKGKQQGGESLMTVTPTLQPKKKRGRPSKSSTLKKMEQIQELKYGRVRKGSRSRVKINKVNVVGQDLREFPLPLSLHPDICDPLQMVNVVQEKRGAVNNPEAQEKSKSLNLPIYPCQTDRKSSWDQYGGGNVQEDDKGQRSSCNKFQSSEFVVDPIWVQLPSPNIVPKLEIIEVKDETIPEGDEEVDFQNLFPFSLYPDEIEPEFEMSSN